MAKKKEETVPATKTGEEIEDFRQKIAENVRSLRDAKGLSQVQLTMASGIPQTTISKIERNGATITFTTAYKLAFALGCTIHDILPANSADAEAEVMALRSAIGAA